ncbi:hypothetical protein EDB85DRAFT_1902440 [Lactarius pseudohatsudake]|nr:hypothetical protein EDB85DRAFT_1902440 [Lactarius pseudohatsudake]
MPPPVTTAALLLLPLLPVHAHAAILCRTSWWSCHEERTIVGTTSGIIAIIIGLAGVPASMLFPLPHHCRRWCRSGGGCTPCGSGVVAALACCKGWWRRQSGKGWRWRPWACMLQGGSGGGDGDLAPPAAARGVGAKEQDSDRKPPPPLRGEPHATTHAAWCKPHDDDHRWWEDAAGDEAAGDEAAGDEAAGDEAAGDEAVAEGTAAGTMGMNGDRAGLATAVWGTCTGTAEAAVLCQS